MILGPFDPWKSQLCTCPAKLSLNPYTGCPHGCLYCYASSYILRFAECRPKVDLLKRLARDTAKVKPGTLVALSNSSDPYPPQEKDYLRLSRRGRGFREPFCQRRQSCRKLLPSGRDQARSDAEGERECRARGRDLLLLPGRMGNSSGNKLRWVTFIVFFCRQPVMSSLPKRTRA
jgi:hypothetical protein